MQLIITETDLRVAILQLESKQTEEGKLMKEQFLVAVESIKPINLIKSTLKEAVGDEDLKDSLVNSSVGLSAGYLIKLLFQSVSGSPVKKILGTAIMFGIKNLVAKNPETVKSGGRVVFNFIKSMLSDKEKTENNDEERESAVPLSAS
jgi:hypothetical protein